MVERIPTDSETAGSSGWLTNSAVMRVGSRVERIPMDSETAANLGWMTNLAVMRVARMARRYR